MKKLILFITLLASVLSLQAQTQGSACDRAIPIDTSYTTHIEPGEYWFTSTTYSLPLEVYFYPENPYLPAPEVWLDLTCTQGVYDDPELEKLIQETVGSTNTFPYLASFKQDKDDNGQTMFSLSFGDAPRNILFDHGIAYAVPAYIHLICFAPGELIVRSESRHNQCRDLVKELQMNTLLPISAENEDDMYVWPFGDWMNKNYKITWIGESKADFVYGLNCNISRYAPYTIYNEADLSTTEIFMNKTKALDLLNQTYYTEMYVRLYTQGEGILKIEEIDTMSYITRFIVKGIEATIDQENKIISGVLPIGSTLIADVSAAQIEYVSPFGYKPSIVNRATKVNLGPISYILNFTVAKDELSHDATLSEITIDGKPMADFIGGTLTYNDVEVNSNQPMITAKASSDKAQITITQATSVPGTATITVKAEAGETNTYTLHLIPARDTDATAAYIRANGKDIELKEGVYTYTAVVTSIPEITAVPKSNKATIQINQSTDLAHSAYVIITAEAGNITKYTIKFEVDPEWLACNQSAVIGELNTPLLVKNEQDVVMKMPFAKPNISGITATNWSGQRIALMWSGQENVTAYFGVSCIFDVNKPDQTVVDSITITKPKGETRYIVYLTEKQTRELGKHSIDGYLYMRLKTKETNQLIVAQDWTPNGNNNSTLIDINQEYYFPTGHTSDNLYKIYLPDWQKKKVKFSWEGMEKMTMYGAAKWEFRLTASDNTMLTPDFPHQFIASDSWEWDENDIEVLTLHTYMLGGSDFIYVRFITDGFAGTLETTQTGGEVTRSEYVEYENTTLSWQRVEDNILIRTTVPQQVNIFSLQGTLITSQYLTPDAEIVLPRALYIVQGENETGKAW